MNLKRYYFLLATIFAIVLITSSIRNNWNYLKETYHYKTQNLQGDDLNEYAAFMYYKNIQDRFERRHDEDGDQPTAQDLKIERWFDQASKQGSALAKLNLAVLYQNKGDLKLTNKIFKLLQESAELGNADAQFRLGEYYQDGIGVEVDYQKAKYWYEKSAQQGNPAGMNNIGVLYQRGLGVEKNEKISTEWYIKSANLGYSQAMENMTQNYYHGENGLPKDEKKAIEWRKKCSYRTDRIPIQPVFNFKLEKDEPYPNTCKSTLE
jgi:TPR repeat protein